MCVRGEGLTPLAQSMGLEDGDHCGVLGGATPAFDLPAPR